MADLSDTSKIQEFIDIKTRQLQNGTISQKEFNAAMKDAKVGIEGYTAKLSESAQKLKKEVTGLGSAMVQGATGASVYNKSISGASDVVSSFLDKFGLLGKALGLVVTAGAKYVTAVNEQADKLFDTYNDISRSGLATGMTGTFDNLQKFGYTVSEIGQMAVLLKENATVLAQFGGTAYTGANRFADLANSIQGSEVGLQFQRMGMSVDEINKNTAGYLQVLQVSGRLGKETNEQLKESTISYLTEQTRLTKLTGQTSDQQNKVLTAAYAEERFAGTQLSLQKQNTEESLKRYKLNETLTNYFAGQMGPAATTGLKKFMSGAMNDEEIVKFRRTYKTFAKMYDAGVNDESQLLQAAIQDTETAAKDYGTLAILGETEKWITNYAQTQANSSKVYGQSAEENNNKAKEEIKDAVTGSDKAVDAQVGLRTAQRNQTQALEKLLNNGITPVTKQIDNLTSGISAVTGIVGSAAGKTTGVGGPTPTGAESLLRFTGASGSRANFDQLDPAVKNSFLAMVGAYGKTVTIESAKRSSEDQARLYNAWVAAGGSASNPIVNVPGMGRVRMPARPGSSPHEQGRALDLDLGSYSGLASLLGQYGFKTVNGDPGHIQMATGGIVSGPKSGYDATLHGTEAVIPMDGKKAIPVETQEDTMLEQHSKLLSLKISKLDQLIKGMQTHYETSNKILLKQS